MECREILDFLENPCRGESYFFDGDGQSPDIPWRFRYMEPVFLFVRRQLESLPAGQCLRNPRYCRKGAGRELCNLFYNQLYLISQSVFQDRLLSDAGELDISEQLAFLENCALSHYAGIWRDLLKIHAPFRKMVMGWIEDFICHVIGMMQHFQEAYDRIRNQMGKEPGAVTEISGEASDLHDGACVHIFLLESGERIVYKPRSLRLDQIWQEFMLDMADRAGLGKFYSHWILDFASFGLEEYVTAEPVEEEDIPVFFYRCGFLLGLAYVLQGSDLHAENMIAHKDWPVLVDLDTGVRVCDNTIFSDIRDSQGQWYRFDSVLRTNMLPFLTAAKGLCPGNDAFTSQINGSQNLPVGAEGKRTALSYADEVEAGFGRAYDTVQKYGLPRSFDTCRARYLLRNTSAYHGFLVWLCQKESILSWNVYEERMDYLEEMYQCLDHGQQLLARDLLPEEQSAVRRGYIPRLTTELSRPWRSGKSGKQPCIAELVRGKLKTLCAEDRDIQCRRIRIALYRGGMPDRLYLETQRGKTDACLRDLIEKRIKLWNRRLQKGDYVEGIVVSQKNKRYYLTGLPWNMMEGIPGLLPFLGAWYFLTQAPEARRLFQHIAARTLYYLRHTNLSAYKPGLAEGLEGLWGMTEIVRTFIRTDEIDLIRKVIKEEWRKPKKQKEFDFDENKKWELEIGRMEAPEPGLMEGIDGVLFPSYFHGEGGWLYTMLKRHYSQRLPGPCLAGKGGGECYGR